MYKFMTSYKNAVIKRNEERKEDSEYKLTEEQINEIFAKSHEESLKVKKTINNLCNKDIWKCGEDIESLNGYFDMGNMRFSFRETFALLSEMMNMFVDGNVCPSYITEKFLKLWRFLNHYELVEYANKEISEYYRTKQ